MAFGFGVLDDETFPVQLENMLTGHFRAWMSKF